MSNQKLKPCPFCGGDADFRIYNRGRPMMKVVCMKCRVETPHGPIVETLRGPIVGDEFKCDKEYIEATKIAAERWNRRAE